MAKAKTAYVCAECGASALQWFGTCPSCAAVGTLTETAVEKGASHRYAAEATKAVTLWGEGLSADEVAAAAGTLSYELLCALAARVPVTEVP